MIYGDEPRCKRGYEIHNCPNRSNCLEGQANGCKKVDYVNGKNTWKS